ncbi:hypothetical protein OQA88_2639 [Cercophora sp. LCS_1]
MIGPVVLDLLLSLGIESREERDRWRLFDDLEDCITHKTTYEQLVGNDGKRAELESFLTCLCYRYLSRLILAPREVHVPGLGTCYQFLSLTKRRACDVKHSSPSYRGPEHTEKKDEVCSVCVKFSNRHKQIVECGFIVYSSLGFVESHLPYNEADANGNGEEAVLRVTKSLDVAFANSPHWQTRNRDDVSQGCDPGRLERWTELDEGHIRFSNGIVIIGRETDPEASKLVPNVGIANVPRSMDEFDVSLKDMRTAMKKGFRLIKEGGVADEVVRPKGLQ